MIKVNAIGDACPIPVVKTKNAIKELNGGGQVETLVDNEIAVQNLTKMAQQKGYGVFSEKVGQKEFRVVMTISEARDGGAEKGADTRDDISAFEEVCIPDLRRDNKVVVISSNCMGSGDDALGAVLIKGFLYAISQQDSLPATILFYNGGVKLACEGAPSVEDLKSMEAQGVEILACGTCLNHYGLTDQLAVGSVTNMYVIAEKMTNASLIIKP